MATVEHDEQQALGILRGERSTPSEMLGRALPPAGRQPGLAGARIRL